MVAVQIFPRRTVFYFRIFHWELFHWRSVLEKSWGLDTCFCLSVEEKKRDFLFSKGEIYSLCSQNNYEARIFWWGCEGECGNFFLAWFREDSNPGETEMIYPGGCSLHSSYYLLFFPPSCPRVFSWRVELAHTWSPWLQAVTEGLFCTGKRYH